MIQSFDSWRHQTTHVSRYKVILGWKKVQVGNHIPYAL